MPDDSVASFMEYMRKHKGLFYPSIETTYANHPALFTDLAELLLGWAARTIGENYQAVLADGYSYFVIDVNKSQMRYEKTGRYASSRYQQVYMHAYGKPEHMNKYHWGVFVTTFAWEHHLKLYRFYKNYFLGLLPEHSALLDLGSGSGIWGLLLLNSRPNASLTGVDISETSVDLAQRMASLNGYGSKASYLVHDALEYQVKAEYDVGISCFLAEHLENPQRLFSNLSANLKAGGYAFVTCALTAAEMDHIYEFKRESEAIEMVESAGFRVIASYSAAPEQYSYEYRYLPRSMGMVLQKRHNDTW